MKTTERTFSITESQIKELIEKCPSSQCKEDYIKELFPEAFEKEDLPECFTGWVFDEKYPKIIAYSEKGFLKYGFNAYGNWVEDTRTKLKNERKATESEVFEALKNEAVKRGFVGNVYVDLSDIGFKNDDLLIASEIKLNGSYLDYGTRETAIFKNGKWGKVISITKQEAEKKLNKKIVD